MRQAGFLAAAAIYGIDHHRDRLQQDHQRLALLAQKLQNIVGSRGEVVTAQPNTNILYLNVNKSKGESLHKALTEQKIYTHLLGPGKFRFLTHLHIEDSDIDEALRRLELTLPLVLR